VAASSGESNAGGESNADAMAPQPAAMSATQVPAITPQVALDFGSDGGSSQATVSTFERVDIAQVPWAAAESASPLLLEPRLRTTAAVRKGGASASLVGGDSDAAALAADEYFRALARVDDDSCESGAIASLVNGPRGLRPPTRRMPATA
jgi:hypothetical protein